MNVSGPAITHAMFIDDLMIFLKLIEEKLGS